MLRALLFSALVVGCAATAGESSEDDAIAVGGKADGIYDMRAGETTVWLESNVERGGSEDAPLFVMHGRASRNLVGGSSSSHEGYEGTWTQPSPRVFEITWSLDDAEALLGAEHQLVELELAESPDPERAERVWLRGAVRPVVSSTWGSGVFLHDELVPVATNGRLMYRLGGSSPGHLYELKVRVGDEYLTTVRVRDNRDFHLDLTPRQVLELAGTEAQLEFAARLIGGKQTKSASLGLVVMDADLRADRPHRPRQCGFLVRGCLETVAEGTVDVSSCPDHERPAQLTWFDVMSCSDELGTEIGRASIDDAVAEATRQLEDPEGFRKHAEWLVGADRAEQYRGAALDTVADRLGAFRGGWVLDETAAEAILAADLKLAIDEVYARPLDYVAPLSPDPDDVDRMRQIAADGLLERAASSAQEYYFQRYFSQSIVDLMDWGRTDHAESLRILRSEPEPRPVTGDFDDDGTPEDALAFDGYWLDLPVSVFMNAETGAVASAYIEID